MNRSDYRKHFAALKALATEAGVDIDVDYRPRKLPEKQGISGSYRPDKKYITIVVYGNVARKLILACLAHEVRHAQHHHQGLFADYYDSRFEDPSYCLKVVRGQEKAPDIRLHARAENDCNKFAIRWLKERGIALDPKKKSHSSYFEPYPLSSVYTYKFYRTIQQCKKNPPVLQTGVDYVNASCYLLPVEEK